MPKLCSIVSDEKIEIEDKQKSVSELISSREVTLVVMNKNLLIFKMLKKCYLMTAALPV